MELLASLKAQDVEVDVPSFDYDSFTPRSAVRAILLDGSKICLIHVSEHGYYMLPGGGIDEGEDVQGALLRELEEEVGCRAEMVAEIGSIVIFNDRWRKKQTDFCYSLRKTEGLQSTAITDFEASEGHTVIWVSDIHEAIRIVESAKPDSRDGKLIKARDLLFLKTFQSTL
jgi:8-oxo-dGTP pyrophosphatase MutT (NUDIX family)